MSFDTSLLGLKLGQPRGVHSQLVYGQGPNAKGMLRNDEGAKIVLVKYLTKYVSFS